MKIIIFIFTLLLSFTEIIASESSPPHWSAYDNDKIYVGAFFKEEDGKYLYIFLRNLTPVDQAIMSNGVDGGIDFFFVNGDGSLTSLHNYNPPLVTPSLLSVKPNSTRSFKIPLSENDFLRLKSSLVKYTFTIYDNTTYEKLLISSDPIQISFISK